MKRWHFICLLAMQMQLWTTHILNSTTQRTFWAKQHKSQRIYLNQFDMCSDEHPINNYISTETNVLKHNKAFCTIPNKQTENK